MDHHRTPPGCCWTADLTALPIIRLVSSALPDLGTLGAGRIPAEINRLQLDLLARRASRALTEAGVPHALLKGPTTSLWLYDPPRPYTDVDLLVPPSRIPEAVRVLASAGVALPTAGRFGEAAPHSQVLLADRGFEIDLHGTLPTLTVDRRDSDRTWRALSAELHPFELAPGWEPIPALSPPARGVVLALHALGCGVTHTRGMEDLRRGRLALGELGWRRARELAAGLDVVDRFDLMSALITGGGRGDLPKVGRELELRLAGATAARIRLAQLRPLPLRQQAAALAAEIFPTGEFLQFANPAGSATSRFGVVRFYLQRMARMMTGVIGRR